jgi:hypothetical protein
MADAGGLTVVSVEGYGDVEAERAHWKRMRLADNRFYSIKPVMRYLNSLYAKTPLTHVPLSRSHGLIVVVRKN